jgi:hypothetical protein
MVCFIKTEEWMGGCGLNKQLFEGEIKKLSHSPTPDRRLEGGEPCNTTQSRNKICTATFLATLDKVMHGLGMASYSSCLLKTCTTAQST